MYVCGVDIKEIRYRNARYLASKHNPKAPQSGFADLLKRSSSQINQIIGAKAVKPIGNKIAREIETACDQPPGWLDQPHRALWEGENLNLQEVDLELYAEAAQMVTEYNMTTGRRTSRRQFFTDVERVYYELVRDETLGGATIDDLINKKHA